MKSQELRTRSSDELRKLLTEKQAGVLNFRFRVFSGRVKNINELSETRKDIARILTILQEKKQ